MDELKQRLRAELQLIFQNGQWVSIGPVAAARIAELEAENARLEADNATLQFNGRWKVRAEAAEQRVDELEAHIEWLEGLIKDLASRAHAHIAALQGKQPA